MHATLERIPCPDCGYRSDADAPACGMCGRPLRAAPPPREAPRVEFDFEVTEPEREPWQRPIVVLAIGAVIAPAFAFLPLVATMGWFLSALCHEIGHTVAAWFFGMPAFPAIRLDGHAASVHQPQKTFLVLLVLGGLAALAWLARRRPPLLIAAVCAAVSYPFLAWSNGKEVLHLLGGHLGEYAFATVFLWRALDGGFSQSAGERVLYAALGWYLVGDHAAMCLGLLTSPAAVMEYRANGSFGLTNDYVRLAEDVLGCRLGTVAFGMLAAAALPPLAALATWAWRRQRA